MDRHHEALADINKAIELCPSHAGFHHKRGMLHYFFKDDRRAVEDFTNSILHDPTEYFTSSSHFWRAMAHLNLGMKEEARKDAAHIPDDYLELERREGEDSDWITGHDLHKMLEK